MNRNIIEIAIIDQVDKKIHWSYNEKWTSNKNNPNAEKTNGTIEDTIQNIKASDKIVFLRVVWNLWQMMIKFN